MRYLLPAIRAPYRIQIQRFLRTGCQTYQKVFLLLTARPRELLGGCHLFVDYRQRRYAPQELLALQQPPVGLWLNPSLRPSLHQDCNAGRYRRTRSDTEWKKAKDSEIRFHQGDDSIRTQRESNQQHRQEVPPLCSPAFFPLTQMIHS